MLTTWGPRLAFLCVVCLVVPVAAGTLAQPAAGDPAPRLVIPETTLDFGRVAPGTKASVQAVVQNTGSKALDIRKIRTTCPCLTVTAPSTVPPSGQTTLRFDFVPPKIGEVIEEQAVLYSSDPVKPVAVFEFSGSVGTAIRVLPEGIAVPGVRRRDLPKAHFSSVQLTSLDGAPIGRIQLVPSHSAIEPQSIKMDDGSYAVGLTMDDSMAVGSVNESIKVITEHPKVPIVEIPILGMINGDLDPEGRRIDFGFIKEGQPASMTFRLRNRGPRETKVVRTEAKLPVPAEVEVTPEGNEFKIVVRVAPQPAFARLIGKVELHTDDPAERVVPLEVYGGVLADKPFEQAARDGSDARLFEIVKDALSRGERIPEDKFFSEVLGGVKDERATGLLLRAAEEGELQTRMRAVELLAAFKAPEVVRRVAKLVTDDPHEFVRRRAIAAHVQQCGKGAVPLAIIALQDNEAWVKEDAATFLGKLGDPSAIPALKVALTDPDPDVNAAVREALISLQGAAKK